MYANAKKLSNFSMRLCETTNIDLTKMGFCMLNFIYLNLYAFNLNLNKNLNSLLPRISYSKYNKNK